MRPTLKICSLVERWTALGQNIFPDGTRWIAHTPERAPLAYLHQLFASLDDNLIDELELDLEYPLPRTFRQFLRLHNGIGLFADSINIYGLRRSWSRTNLVEAAQQPFSIFTPNFDERPQAAQEDVLFIGSLGGNGDLVAVVPDGRVFCWMECRQSIQSTMRVFSHFSWRKRRRLSPCLTGWANRAPFCCKAGRAVKIASAGCLYYGCLVTICQESFTPLYPHPSSRPA